MVARVRMVWAHIPVVVRLSTQVGPIYLSSGVTVVVLVCSFINSQHPGAHRLLVRVLLVRCTLRLLLIAFTHNSRPIGLVLLLMTGALHSLSLGVFLSVI